MNAAELLAAREQANQNIQARIEELRGIIASANEELVALGAKRVRKPKAEGKKRGRPVGSRNRKPEDGGLLA